MTTNTEAMMAALEALKKLRHDYVKLMEAARDRITDFGGTCDPLDVMERNDPALKSAGTAIAALAQAEQRQGVDELAAWRSRFPMYVYRLQDDCIGLRAAAHQPEEPQPRTPAPGLANDDGSFTPAAELNVRPAARHGDELTCTCGAVWQQQSRDWRLMSEPQPSAWVGLTDEERHAVLISVDPETKRLPPGFRDFAAAIESALRAKNASSVGSLDAVSWQSILEAVMREMPHRGREDGNAPGHGHAIPGIWDKDNGELAGKECAWCKAWNTARAALRNQEGEKG